MGEKARNLTIVVTGTDTGVGKTVVTALLTAHLQLEGKKVGAFKPFCSGGTEDRDVLHDLQRETLSPEEVTPFCYQNALAPYACQKIAGEGITPSKVLRPFEKWQRTYEFLLVEGAGGLLTPLGKNFTALDLLGALDAVPIVIAADKLGVINQVSLCLSAMNQQKTKRAVVIMVEQKAPDESTRTNCLILEELYGSAVIIKFPWMKRISLNAKGLQQAAKKMRNILAQIIRESSLSALRTGET